MVGQHPSAGGWLRDMCGGGATMTEDQCEMNQRLRTVKPWVGHSSEALRYFAALCSIEVHTEVRTCLRFFSVRTEREKSRSISFSFSSFHRSLRLPTMKIRSVTVPPSLSTTLPLPQAKYHVHCQLAKIGNIGRNQKEERRVVSQYPCTCERSTAMCKIHVSTHRSDFNRFNPV